MRDTIAEALNLEHWYASPQGSYALLREKRLLQRVLSAWPRRGHSLLEVECGTGIFLDFFWEGGFDVTGTDAQPDLVALAQDRLNGRAEIQTSVPEYLPFPDNEFDYVALVHVLEYAEDAPLILAEALRVAAKGVVIAFSNPWSLAAFGHACRKLLPVKKSLGLWNSPQSFSAWHYYKMLRAQSCSARFCLRSTLPGPQWTWGRRFSAINTLTLPLPFGALGVLRIDHCLQHSGTGLPLHLKRVCLKKLTPVRIMERSRKDIP